jgi:small-conductance mechanosensitive channel
VLFTLGISDRTPYDNAAAIPGIVRGIVEAQPLARFERAHFKHYGESALIYEVVYFVRGPDYTAYMDTQQAINLEILRRFAGEGISFAHPTRTVHVRSGAEDG